MKFIKISMFFILYTKAPQKNKFKKTKCGLSQKMYFLGTKVVFFITFFFIPCTPPQKIHFLGRGTRKSKNQKIKQVLF
jgi:hypothetical protein